jgi:hypothetical protein
MRTKRPKRIALAQLLVSGCAAVFCACVPIGYAQAQFAVPPPPPPVFNPSPPNTTVTQPSYEAVPPATTSGVSGADVTSPVNEKPPSRTARSEPRASVAKTRSVHHHDHRGRFAGPTLGHYCGYSPCVRIRRSAFYGGAASFLWWPAYYDYAPGQFGRGRPRYGGYWRRSGYHGD